MTVNNSGTQKKSYHLLALGLRQTIKIYITTHFSSSVSVMCLHMDAITIATKEIDLRKTRTKLRVHTTFNTAVSCTRSTGRLKVSRLYSTQHLRQDNEIQ